MNRITLIGAGNVAFHLGKALVAAGVAVQQVFSREYSSASELAHLLQAEAIDRLDQVQPDVSVLLIAVSDDAIGAVGQQLAEHFGAVPPLVVHTSGATPSTVLSMLPRYGVFYPLQTFSKDRPVDFSAIPICVDAPQAADLEVLKKLAHRISDRVFPIDDEQRAVLHVAAVFANNFTNHLLALSQQITDRANLPFDLLRPLILETALKAQDFPPAEVQTGPAKRGDRATRERHLAYLRAVHPELVAVYELLDGGIRDQY